MEQALQTMITNMPEKTGKSLEEWHEILDNKKFEKHGEALKFLKTEYAVSHGFANTIVSLHRNPPKAEDDLLGQQYQGKEALIPIYEALIDYVNTLGNDISIVPKKGSVSVIRKWQFILIKPATKTRIDLGFKLKDVPTTNRLGPSGPFGTMCTHRVQLSTLEEVDDELKSWVLRAYNMSV